MPDIARAKICVGCGALKALADFTNSRQLPDGKLPRCRICERARMAAWHARNPDRSKKYQARYRKDNREKVRQADRRWRQANPAVAYETLRKSRLKFPERRREQLAQYRARMLKATPPWLTEAQRAAMQEIYKEAVQLSNETGIPHHVDHVVPLRGRNVWGLHVPWNLQILPAVFNIKKGNRHG